MEVKGTVSKDNIKNLVVVSFRLTSITVPVFVLIALGFLALFALKILWLAVLLFALAVAALPLALLYRTLIAEKTVKLNLATSPEVHCNFSEDGFVYTREKVYAVAYNAVPKILLYKKCLYLYTDQVLSSPDNRRKSRIVAILPVDSLEKSEAERLTTLLSQKIGQRFVTLDSGKSDK